MGMNHLVVIWIFRCRIVILLSLGAAIATVKRPFRMVKMPWETSLNPVVEKALAIITSKRMKMLKLVIASSSTIDKISLFIMRRRAFEIGTTVESLEIGI